ncbi:extended synaptotagmin-2-like isoform X2 [Tachypleus tridentatus]
MWPYIGHYVEDLLRTKVEPSVRESLPSYLRSFRFEKIVLGDMPPRIGGVKVYEENVGRDEIIMDLEILYSGDSNFLVGVKGFKAGIKDVQLHGKLRVIMKPLVKQIPFAGGVTVFFLSCPAIDFNLTNLADVLDIPGLSDILHQAVLDQLSALMVLPNKIYVSLVEDVPLRLLKFVPPTGVLRIKVIAGKDLKKADVGMFGLGSSDPYAVVKVGSQEFRTSVVENSINPQWNYYCEAVVDQVEGQSVLIDIMDKDPSSKDDFLGRISLNISTLIAEGRSCAWHRLQDIKTGKINVDITWLALSEDPESLHAEVMYTKSLSSKTSLSSALLLVFVDSAKHLPNASQAASEPSPLIELTVGANKVCTSVKPNTNDPVWEENFHFLMANPENEEVVVQVKDEKSEKPLGHCVIPTNFLLKEKGLQLDQPFFLKDSGSESQIILMLHLKILKSQTTAAERPEAEVSEEKDDSVQEEDKGKEEVSKTSDVVPPSLEDVVLSTVTPVLDSAKVSKEVLDESIRHRGFVSTTSTEEKELPKVQLTLRYSMQRNKLIVVVHKVVNLPYKDEDGLPDPYVKVYLIADSKETKQKTHVCQNTANPVFDETLEYVVNSADLSSYTLDVSVNSKQGNYVFTRGKELGKATIDLSIIDLNKAHTEWFNLKTKED